MNILIKTYGCTFNFSDSEIMAGFLKKAGYNIVNSEDKADLVIINSCTVKNNAETKFWRDVRNIKKTKILAGCVPQAEKDKEKFKDYSVVGTNQINKIVDVVDKTLAGNIVQLYKLDKEPRINIPKVRRNDIIEIVPISDGCLGRCDFCITKIARGHLYSYSQNEIVKHVRNALNNGAKEIWLTSQDTACYGYDIETNIVNLLNKILEIKRDFKIRLGMGNPNFLPDYLDELIEVYKNPRMFKFLHIPVQAGSNNVLKAMNRNYTVVSFIDIVEKFRKVHPDLTLSTDIICGHPDETDKDFNKTIKLVKKVRPDVLNISRFWARPYTLAAKKKQLPSQIIKQRSVALTNLFRNIAYKNNQKWLNWTGDVLIDEIGKNNSYIGRNYAYKPVVVKGNLKLGDTIKVKIKNVTSYDLRG